MVKAGPGPSGIGASQGTGLEGTLLWTKIGRKKGSEGHLSRGHARGHQGSTPQAQEDPGQLQG